MCLSSEDDVNMEIAKLQTRIFELNAAINVLAINQKNIIAGKTIQLQTVS